MHTVKYTRQFLCCLVYANPYIRFGGRKLPYKPSFVEVCNRFAQIGINHAHSFNFALWQMQKRNIIISDKIYTFCVQHDVCMALSHIAQTFDMPRKVLFWAMVWHGMRCDGYATTLFN